MSHKADCPCNNADERGCFLVSAETGLCVSCTCGLAICALCGHESTLLGASYTGPDWEGVAHLCHGCDDNHPCYHAWTIYGQRPEEQFEDISRTDDWAVGDAEGYERGQRDMLAKCIEALIAQAATGTARCDGDECHEWADAIRTLRALQEKP